jgi:hypothetical protein
MMPPLDVYSIRNNESTWLGPAKTLIQALEVMRQSGAGSYYIFFHQTGHQAKYQVDEHGSVRPVEAESPQKIRPHMT